MNEDKLSQENLKETKVHKIVNQFNQKEVIDNPNWGHYISQKNEKRIQSATSYKQKRQLVSPGTYQLKQREKTKFPTINPLQKTKNEFHYY